MALTVVMACGALLFSAVLQACTGDSLSLSDRASASASVSLFTSLGISTLTSVSSSLSITSSAPTSLSKSLSASDLSTIELIAAFNIGSSASESVPPSISIKASVYTSVSPSSSLRALALTSSVSSKITLSKSLSTNQSASKSAPISSFISPSRSSSISQSTFSSSVLNRDNMYPHGPEQGDEALTNSGYWYLYLCQKIEAPSLGFPFYGKRHYKLYICPDGKIQLNYEWRWWWPQRFGAYRWLDNIAMMTPFWADIDGFALRNNYSHVYYHVYQRTVKSTIQKTANEVLTMASEHVQHYDKSGGFTQFQANWILVVTWENLCPYRYYAWDYGISGQKCSRSNTFQAVIITDQINTFLMYNYPGGGIQWVVPFDQCVSKDDESCSYWANWYGTPVAGWNAGDDQRHNYLNMKG